ncbi:uncharacterized protein LOC122036708 [Zingiber officinale]|uniref:uncharacterized protein LOC122036708 n=1 Tax=Zingiber officinale TaxID=94328 RepID=UPI001C4B46B4|nr:uncharacterized protein LOC122036708 [Zingiber officinale]
MKGGGAWWRWAMVALIDEEEATTQLCFAFPMILTNVSYYAITLVSVNSWGAITGSPPRRPSGRSPPHQRHPCHLVGATLAMSSSGPPDLATHPDDIYLFFLVMRSRLVYDQLIDPPEATPPPRGQG